MEKGTKENEMTKRMVFTMGLPGSGKSTVVNDRYAPHGYAIIDPDLFKATHPDYDPKDTSIVHDWSMDMAEEAFKNALTTDGLWVVDGTGVNAERMVRRINEAKAVGYDVSLVYVKVSVETALIRNAERPRSVPDALIISKARDIDTSFAIIEPHCDAVLTIKND